MFAPFYAPNLGADLFKTAPRPPVFPFAGSEVEGADLDFGNRFGLTRLGKQTHNLMEVLENPAQQLTTILGKYQNINSRMTKKYQEYVGQLRGLAIPEEEVAYRADQYITPILNTEMELLRMEYPFSLGGAAGGSLNPIVSLANGAGNVNEAAAGRQFKNWRSLKKAFKAKKHHRKSKKHKAK